ncbi:hypothetical protein [Streptomyces sp. NPDC004008]
MPLTRDDRTYREGPDRCAGRSTSHFSDEGRARLTGPDDRIAPDPATFRAGWSGSGPFGGGLGLGLFVGGTSIAADPGWPDGGPGRTYWRTGT